MQKIIPLLLFVVVLGYTPSADRLLAQTEEPPLQLAFVRNNDICIINLDGTGQYCLMQTDDVRDYNPVWSSDGRFLTFESYAINEGTAPATTSLYEVSMKKITLLPESWHIYDWSVDGRYLLITQVYDMESLVTDIAVIRSNGSDVQTLTDSQNTYNQPAWSPDGKQIAYLSGFPEADLMVMSVTGEDQRVLTDGLDVNGEVQPQWSPDSQTLVFAVIEDHANSRQTRDIYTIQVDGTNLLRLTDTDHENWNPHWSPDGTQLVFFGVDPYAFEAERNSDPINMLTEVYRINADGSGLVNLTQNRGLDYQPVWSPDGKWIAFASTRVWESEEPRPGIFIMRPDGSDVRMVTNEPPYTQGGREANNPVWRPVPSE